MRRLLLGLICVVLSLTMGLPVLVNYLSPVRIQERETRVRLYVHSTGRIEEIPLEEYVTGVVAAEMPAAFPIEALKAQAVAARTYIVRRLTAGGVLNNEHPGADVCDDHTHGQAWISREEMRRRWGTVRYYEYYYKIKKAVDETRGLVLTYEGQLIEAAYHASCGGRGTESASAVWAADLPYLVGVPCPYDADPEPVRTVSLPVTRVDRALGVNLEAVPVAASSHPGRGEKNFVEVLERTPAGRPKTVRIGEKKMAAAVVRDLLDLRSVDFNMILKGDRVEITTRGYGHAVGMCQYGAKGLAEHGYTFDRILKHYYTGVELTRIN
ncbi:stage II sporulation protein D [Desulfofundulus luciae]|uniref:Stage II sporulation protein D n=1 Tax=Desulfofundulus luciae TaxID=74702 RepID=A0ABU0AX31_9FIRM|nr:stage II sporulation protein D [Desulfofundulus luciae]MDQ0285050.1 stage II sporulation protein D [Desulfofundulus luciae]